MLLTTVLIVVLVVIGIAAVVSVPLMIRSTRRQLTEDAPAGARKPIMGSPAQVWVSRGERVLRELGTTLGEHAALHGIAADAGRCRRRAAAHREPGRRARPRTRPDPGAVAGGRSAASLATALAEAQGRPAAADLARSHDGGVRAARGRGSVSGSQRDALVAKMQATVTELERARDELAELIAGTAVAAGDELTDAATAQLTGRLDALREGLVEVRAGDQP